MSDLGAFVLEDSEISLGSSLEEDFEKDSSENKIKYIKIIFFILCVILIGEFVGYKYIMPSFSSPKVTVSGQKNFSAEEIASKLLVMDSTNWFDFDVDKAAAILSSEPAIESVTVEKHFPDKINVNIVERESVALTFIVEDGYSVPVSIDKNGVLFSNAGKQNKEAIVPIISGIPVEYMSGGMRIPAKYRPLLDQIAKIMVSPQNYFASIAEICVLPKEFGNYELALIPSQSKVKVLTDCTLNEESLKYMMVALDVVNWLGTDVLEVDLRYGAVSYRTR